MLITRAIITIVVVIIVITIIAAAFVATLIFPLLRSLQDAMVVFSMLVIVFSQNWIVGAILGQRNVFLLNLLGIATNASIWTVAVKSLKFRIYWTFIRLLPSTRTFIVISHINMTLVLKDNPVTSSAPEPLRLKNIFPAKQHRSNGLKTNQPRT